jgi:nitrogen-specific signal transduction histidine kinase
MSASIINLNGLPHVLTITRDLTERNRAEEEKAELEARLQQAQKMEAIGTLAGGIAHDFNNILTAILGYTEIAISELPQGSGTRDSLEEVFKASLRAIDLVKQILVFSRKSEIQLFPIRIHLIIKEALKLLRASLPATIEMNQNIRASGKVLADITHIHQIMMNLCTNASHAMSENGGVLSVSLTQVNLPDETSRPINLPPGPYLKLTVSDTGCGMAPDVCSRIFEPYYTTKGIDKGTGLGLAVVHGIVESHGGLITVESTPGKGSRFHVYLPEIMDSGLDTETIQAVLPDAMGTERILFVDDEMTIVGMGKKMLEKLGYEVAGSTSGEEALKLFKAAPDQFDLVITDMTMPHMTGDQLSRKFIEIRPDIPIILCSGFSENMTEEAAKEIGIREFISKPMSRQVLSKTIRNVLDG